jgi:23S rRNA pseudouridine2605 synthase
MKNSYNKSKSFGKSAFRTGSGPTKPSGKPTAPKRRSDERAFESRYKSTESKAFKSRGGLAQKSADQRSKFSERPYESRPRPAGGKDFKPRGGSSERSYESRPRPSGGRDFKPRGGSSERSYESRPRPAGGRDFKPRGGSSERSFESRPRPAGGRDFKPRGGSSERSFESRPRPAGGRDFKPRGGSSERSYESRPRPAGGRDFKPKTGGPTRGNSPHQRMTDRDFEMRRKSGIGKDYKPSMGSTDRDFEPRRRRPEELDFKQRGASSKRDFEPRRRSDEDREIRERSSFSERSSAPRGRTSDRDFEPRRRSSDDEREFKPRRESSERSSAPRERSSDRDFEPRRRSSDERDSKTRSRTPEKGTSPHGKPTGGRDYEITNRGLRTTGFKKRPSPKQDTRSKSQVKDEIKKKENLFDINEGLRLNRYIAECGIAARRKADEIILSGVVKINGFVVTELGTKVMPGDFVTIAGDPIWLERHFEYILLNKPKGVITTTSDEKNRATVMDLIKRHGRVYPVGRLDRNTTGVLLLTNDGELAYRLTHPKYEVERVYNVKLDKDLNQLDAEKVAKGVMIDGAKTAPCQVMMYTDAPDRATLTLTEGRNHEVKKLFEAVGYDVKTLDRKYFATLSTSGMKRGEYRNLTDAEVKEIKLLVELI